MLLKSIRVYDADAAAAKQKARLLKQINSLREHRPGMQVSGWQLLKFFAKVLVGAGLLFLAAMWRSL